MKRPAAILLMLCMLLSLVACSQPAAPDSQQPPEAELPETASPQEPNPPAVEIIPAPEDPLDTLLSSMTLEEKVGQLFFARVPAENAAEDVSTYHLGGYILFGRDTKDKTANELIQTIASYQNAAKIPLLIGVDEEGGTVVRVSSNPHIRSAKFQSPQKLFAKGGLESIQADAEEKSILLKALGFNVNLAPVADISISENDFIHDRSFGQDAAATETYTRTVVSAMTDCGMGSVLKHFPGYGNNVDTHTGIATDSRPYETFLESDFLPFRAHECGNGMTAILVSHNIVESMDAALPASLSPAVHNILREELAFDGVIMTDDLAMDAVKSYAETGSTAVMALQAGNDLIISSDYAAEIATVLEAVEYGILSEDTVNSACRRVLEWKSALGLL